MMSPAEVVIEAFGGVRATARVVGRQPSAVTKWKWPKERRGCDGNIPSGLHQRILMEAEKRGIVLVANDLIWGR